MSQAVHPPIRTGNWARLRGRAAGRRARAGIEEVARGRAVLGILGQHAAREVGDGRGEACLAHKRGEAADLQLAACDGGRIERRERGQAQRQRHHQRAERVHVVGDAALAPAAGQAHRRIGRLEQRGLQGGGRRGPALAQGDGLAGRGLKHVVGTDGAVGDAARTQPLQRLRGRAQEAIEQLRLAPGARCGAHGRAGRGRADDVVCFLAGAARRTDPVRQRP